jgi:hypothetical protein
VSHVPDQRGEGQGTVAEGGWAGVRRELGEVLPGS